MSKSKTAAKRWPLPPRTTAVLLVIAFLIVVSTAIASDGAMVRRNTSRTPDLETENAQLSMAQFYVEAQRANGTLVTEEAGELNDKTEDESDTLPGVLEYYNVVRDDDGAPDYSADPTEEYLQDQRSIAKPLVVTYFDEIEHEKVAALPVSLGDQLAKAFDDAFGAEALASGGVPDPEHRLDAFASVSFDDGETWKQYNLSETADLSSFTLADGTVYPGTVDYGVKHSMAGNKILVVWHSKYAMGGSPRYSLAAVDKDGVKITDDYGKPVPLEYYGFYWGDPVTGEPTAEGEGVFYDGVPVRYDDPDFDAKVLTYDLNVDTGSGGVFDDQGDTQVSGPVPLDMWGVSGSQKSIDYETWMHHGVFPFAEVGEVPFSAIWTCRGVIQQVTKYVDDDDDTATAEVPKTAWDVKWRKAERLTSATRDAMYTAIDGAEGVGFGVVWQEDPEGLRPGYGEGPGEGWSGSTANHKTDLWYSFISWDDFDKVKNPAVGDKGDEYWDDYWVNTEDNYLQTPDEVDELGWNTDKYSVDDEDLTTNKPQVFERMSMPIRITDNNNIMFTPRMNADTGQIVDLYAYVDRLELDEDTGLYVPAFGSEATGADGAGDDIADLAATPYEWPNTHDGTIITSAVTQDGRLMNGQTASTRCRMMMEGYVKEDLVSRGAWVLLGYEETKGLGPGMPLDPGSGQPIEDDVALDIGKTVKCETFAYNDPNATSFAAPGHMINTPEWPEDWKEPDAYSWTTAADFFPVIDPAAELTDPVVGKIPSDYVPEGVADLQYATAIARRPSLMVNPIFKLQPDETAASGYSAVAALGDGDTSAVMLYKEGRDKQGGPADIMMRRWVINDPTFDPHKDNPFDYKYLVADLPSELDEDLVWEADEDADRPDGSIPGATDVALPEILEPPAFEEDDVWDKDIVFGVDNDSAADDPEYSNTAYPKSHYPNGFMLRGALNLSSTYPVDLRLIPDSEKMKAVDAVPLFHLDLYPDLAAKYDDGTLSYTDCAVCHPDTWGATIEGSEDPAHGILERVWAWDQYQWNLYDDFFTNWYELSKGHRGYVDNEFVDGDGNPLITFDGDFVQIMFGYAPNWLFASHGKEPINLFVRRSFDGGKTWTTTPDELVDTDDPGYTDGTLVYEDQVQGVGTDVLDDGVTPNPASRVFWETDRVYEPGDFEEMRNVSLIYSSSGTIIDPRYSPTNFRRQTDIVRQLLSVQTSVVENDALVSGYDETTGVFDFDALPDETPQLVNDASSDPAAARPDDTRDPSKFFAVYETGDQGAVALGLEATAENLYYSRATGYGDFWDKVLLYPNDNPNRSADSSWATWEIGDYEAWDWLENQSETKSGEASIAASPGGQFMWAIWNEWKEDDEENVWDSDAVFRRIYWEADEETTVVEGSIDAEYTAAEGELVELTASARLTVGDEPVSADTLLYSWDLDADTTFETKGQTVTMVATGATQPIAVLVVDSASGARDIATGYINPEPNAPRVWNVKLVKGATGLAGTRVALSANFNGRGPWLGRPAPSDYDASVAAVIDWGDGTIEAGTITSKNDGKGSVRFVTGVHKYGKPGLYTVKVTVTNAYGNSGWDYLEYAVIVHRKAGALAMAGTFEDPNGEGDASIAANVKYKLKGKYPTGKVLFTLGDKSFVSEKLDWMAIQGRKGWVRGQGQLNGVGGYEFLLAVFDDRQNLGDLVRVKVWKANGKMETVVYDSQPDSPLDAVAVTPMKTGKITMPLFKGKSWKYYLMQKK